MKFICVKLRPKGPIHVGERESWREGSKVYVPSDTIFSALCHCYSLLYGDLESLLRPFLDGNPPFLISSAFPFFEDRYFFPVPKNQIPSEKSLKKIAFIELSGLEKLLRGSKLEEVARDAFTIPGKVPVYGYENVPRIGLNRMNSHPGENYFHFGQVTYFRDAGLFLLVRMIDESFSDRLRSLFFLMCHEGLGGDRSSGKGIFEKPEFSEMTIETVEAKGLYTLSTYSPRDEELIGLDAGFYDFEERKGYIYSPWNQSLRRKSVRLFMEGSVFPANVQRTGRLVDVTPKVFTRHRVYRYGFLLSLPCVMEES